MATASVEIVTPERFAQGYTWTEYMDVIKANRDRFLKNYEEFHITEDDAAFFRAFNAKKGPVKLLAIGEDWCPDVVRGLPVAARLAEAGGFEMRIFPRDANLDLMDQYLWRHKYQCIPVFVFFDKDWRELGHWIERPAIGYKFIADIREELTRNNLSEEETLKAIRERREGVQGQWMRETVREIREQIFYRVM